MLNGQNLDQSLANGIDSLKGKKSWLPELSVKIYLEDLNDILSQKAGQYAMKYIKADTRGQSVQTDKTGQVGVTLSPNVAQGARQAQNSPLLKAK